ncbi:dsDNA nuclease domain-containing protein [Pedobacter sp. L105]|uniref:dsDNA nuclease domain-containing protein n=1 Tax=Pedobacter sp. L105 TaxID=1641871 RepID=UPI00131E2477|nr:dsDNA nuclease domain-containing protein [Pedobacter sp. L105]
MGGTENLKGFDYQINISVYKTLQLISNNEADISFLFESLKEEEEDFNIFKKDKNEFYQIKKRSEGYHWTSSDMKEIFSKFLSKMSNSTFFYFITNGTANSEVKKLKYFLSGEGNLTDKELRKFLPIGYTLENLKLLLNNLQISTRFFSSDNDDDPASLVRIAIQKLLHNPPFELSKAIDQIYPQLWQMFFDYARDAKIKTIHEVIEKLTTIGITVQPNKPWLEVPEITFFRGRADEMKMIKEKLDKTHKLILYGINGIGKSWITTKVLLEGNGGLQSVCWISVTKWMSVERFLSLITRYLYFSNHEGEANSFRTLEIFNRLPQVISTLKRIEFTLVIDSLNSGNLEFIDFIKDLVAMIQDAKLSGSLIISSTRKYFSYSEDDIQKGYLSEFHLSVFTFEDMKLIFSENRRLSTDHIDYIYRAVGGHPMSVYFLNNLLEENQFNINNIEDISHKTVEEARDWVISKSIDQLLSSSKDHLLRLSVIDGMISFEEADLLLQASIKSKYLLRDLNEFNLITLHNNGITIHESIREVAVNMLTTKAKFSIHEQLMNYHFVQMKLQKESGDGVSYDSINKWGVNIEALSNFENLLEDYKVVLELDNELLDALWAIARFGYPFDYETDDLSFSQKIIYKLLARKLIKLSDDPQREYQGQKMLYDLHMVDFWQSCLVTHLCLSRGLSHHVGYINIFKPNYAFQEQVAMICLWEHCIEHMPLPPITQSSQLEYINYVKSQFEAGFYDNIPSERKQELQQIINVGADESLPMERNIEMEERACPIFGHCCPGGKEQADLCRANDAIDFDAS